MKKIQTLIVLLCVACCTPLAFADESETIYTPAAAQKTAATITVDGSQKPCTSYLISDSNYVRLRDIASLLKDTGKEFSIAWDEKECTISIISSQNDKSSVIGPAPTHDELVKPPASAFVPEKQYAMAVPTTSRIHINGSEADLQAYTIEDYTYFKLRDLGEALNFGVQWDATTASVSISSMHHYYDLNPVSPWKYQSLLGKGLDVDWSKTDAGSENYNTKTIKDFRDAGVRHVRIRVRDQDSDALFRSLDKQIDDCLKHGIIPVLAYQADEFKNDSSPENMQKVADWWSAVAARYADKSYLLFFDILIEATDALNDQPDKLNQLYETVVAEIRRTNPQRIIMISPRLRSDAAYLHELKIPSAHNGYLMAEWHFYASGPSKDNHRKLWTTGTKEEKSLILDKIALASEWQQKTGIPTWVGAWMPGNYNDGDNYSIQEQTAFAQFMTSSLEESDIPFAVNSDTKFYDREKNRWISHMEPVFSAIFQ